ncbi:peroxisomal oxidase [Gymnopilus junonius]|uniref:Acyl-coenzyme A oxidase n=1 Tax=Gymnopilus junonius TaxID=109634 RepID=A0A9P5NQ47_GYMJU|nr:peroxisomal oxidase [Gymnopilus junonius]
MASKTIQHDVNEQTGVDMTNARNLSTIAVENIRDFLHHGREEWLVRSRIVSLLENDPAFDKSQREFLSRTEKYERGLAMTNRVYDLQSNYGWSEQETKLAFAVLDDQLPIGLHNIAFQPVFMLQGGHTLLKKYGHLITTRAILGCYLQTELGHGTNVSRLETTATYVPQTEEFEIHSPTLTSSKWWIGALGKTATHGVVQAKLILGGKDMGPHLFLVQLRSLDDHSVLPNITIGDIGPKAAGGYATTDNGFARFNHVRIPRENMLSGFAQVTEDGKYVQPPHAKLSYGGMLYIRANMVTGGGWFTAKAATVAIRYATVRRQGDIGTDGLEKQIITYPSVYYRLLPILSRAYMFIQLGRSLTKAFDTMASRLKQGDTSLLAEMHATTSGLKVYVSSNGVQDLETARRAMGGHGYSAFAGLGRLYADYLPSVTYEGDNFVLDQQVVRAALRSYKALFASNPPCISALSPSSYYLRHLVNNPVVSSFSEEDWRNPSTAILLLELRAAFIVNEHAQNTSEQDASVNQRVSKAVTEAFVATQVAGMIQNLDKMPERNRVVVTKVFLLYLLTAAEGGLTDFLSFGIIRPASGPTPSDPTRSVRMAIKKLCEELLPEAIALTDAFGFTNWDLDSALGVYDGKVYEALWERAQTEPLNRTEVSAAYKTSIRPILERGRRQAAAMPKL